MFGISSFSAAPFSTLDSTTHSAIASIDGIATVVAIGGKDIFGAGAITGLRTVVCDARAVSDLGTAFITGSAFVVGTATGTVLIGSGSMSTVCTVLVVTSGSLITASADITAAGSFDASAIRERIGSGAISSTASFVALGGTLVSASGAVSSTVSVSVIGGVVFDNSGSVVGTCTVVSDGHILGNNWVETPVGANTWKRIG